MRDKLRPWFDRPFDMFMVMSEAPRAPARGILAKASEIEGLTTLNSVEGGSSPTAVILRLARPGAT